LAKEVEEHNASNGSSWISYELSKTKRLYAKSKHFTVFSGEPLKNMYLSEINLYRSKRVDGYENISSND